MKNVARWMVCMALAAACVFAGSLVRPMGGAPSVLGEQIRVEKRIEALETASGDLAKALAGAGYRTYASETLARSAARSSSSSSDRFSSARIASACDPFTPVRKSSTSARHEWIDTW